MKWKQISALFFVIALLFAIPLPTHANGWQQIGGPDALNEWWNGKGYVTNVYSSEGGSIKWCVSGRNYDVLYYVYEYDPGTTGSGEDDYIFSTYLKSGECYWININLYDDGSNGEAEIYLATYESGTTMTKLYD